MKPIDTRVDTVTLYHRGATVRRTDILLKIYRPYRLTAASQPITLVFKRCRTDMDAHSQGNTLVDIEFPPNIDAAARSRACAYFKRCGFDLSISSEGICKLDESHPIAIDRGADFQPAQVCGVYASMTLLWEMWRTRYIQHLQSEIIQRWTDDTLSSGSDADRDCIQAWISSTFTERMPRHLQEDLDIALMAPHVLPRHWKLLAHRAAVSA